jgi:hypothetical protein
MVRRSAVLLGLLALAASGGDSPLDRATLRGVKAVRVVVDEPAQPLPKEAIPPKELQEIVTQRLLAAGIPIDPNASEFLGLNATYKRDRRGPYAAVMSLGLYQVLLLSRDREIKSIVETWSVSSLDLAQPRQLNLVSGKALEALTDQFIAAWRSVN